MREFRLRILDLDNSIIKLISAEFFRPDNFALNLESQSRLDFASNLSFRNLKMRVIES